MPASSSPQAPGFCTAQPGSPLPFKLSKAATRPAHRPRPPAHPPTHLEVVAAHDDAHNVLSNVVHIPLDCGHDDDPRVVVPLLPVQPLLLLDEGHQVPHRALHHPRRLDDLRGGGEQEGGRGGEGRESAAEGYDERPHAGQSRGAGRQAGNRQGRHSSAQRRTAAHSSAQQRTAAHRAS